jgi:hypothetical protein
MPTIFLLDTSASLGQVATRNQTRKELVQLGTPPSDDSNRVQAWREHPFLLHTHTAVMHFLKYLEDNHPMEVVGLVALGPTDVGQPLAVPLTRDYGDIRKALYAHAHARPHTHTTRAAARRE